VGFAVPPLSPAGAVRSYRTVSPSPRLAAMAIRFSVALSVGLHRLVVNQHRRPVESGLSSPLRARPPNLPDHPFVHYIMRNRTVDVMLSGSNAKTQKQAYGIDQYLWQINWME
jgi:hypothetical protein